MSRGDIDTPCRVFPLIHIHLYPKVLVHLYLKVLDSLLFFFTYCCLSQRNKLSGKPLSRWVITVAGQSDFMAAGWKMGLCSTSIYIGKC